MNARGQVGRLWPWTALSALALLLSVTPGALWPDFNTRFDSWATWYRLDKPEPAPQFSLDNPPPAFRHELRLFQALVIPPGFIAKLINGLGTEYSLPWVNRGSSTEMAAAFPPLAMFLQHLRYAVPFWLVLLIGAYEGLRLVRRRRAKVA